MTAPSEGLRKVVSARDLSEPHLLPGIYLGRVTRVAGAQLHFVIDDFSPDFAFGPVTYERPPMNTGEANLHTHTMRATADPAVGTKIVVGFLGGDPDRPEVLKIKGWPS